jgi:glycosyltransferase involved in cell wall biosynthesis
LRPIRVGFDATTLTGQISGVGGYTARLLQALGAEAGRETFGSLVVLSNRGIRFAGPPPVEVYAARRFPIRSIWMQLILPGILREVRPDVVHFTNYLAPVLTDAPYVVSFHDMSLTLLPEAHTLKKRLLTASLIPTVAKRARRILVPSESTRRDVARLLPVDPERIRLVPYAASPLYRPLSDGAGGLVRRGVRPPYFLYVGTIEPRKNLARALRAFGRIASSLPDHRFVIVGQSGWKYGEVLKEAQRPDLADKVVLTGYVPEEELPLLYNHAVALVYPSLYEGFGLPLVEAMACGTPVLTSTGSSLSEVAADAAVLVDPLREDDLAQAMSAIATDERLRAGLRERGLLKAAGLSWERTARETLEVYREVAEEGRGPA